MATGIKSLDSLKKYTYFTLNTNELPPAQGLTNTSSICWFNSLIQALLSLTALSEVMLENEDDFILKPLGKAYIGLIKAASSGADINVHRDNVLNEFKNIIGKKIKFLIGGQECANEGFTLFIDALKCKRVEYLFQSIYRSVIVCPKCGAKRVERSKNIQVPYYTDRDISIDDFAGYVKCHRSDVFDYKCPGRDYTVGDDSDDDELNVHANVPMATAVETAVRHGEIIVVTFNKMYNRKRSYPKKLSFKGINVPTINYQLVATIEHNGTTTSGHYWSRCARIDDDADPRWYNINDASVVADSSECRDTVSMLFYHMV